MLVKSRIVQGRYKILVHYYQPSHGKYNGRIIVQSGRSTALYLRFKHCPNVGGCRALARDKITEMSRSLYIYNDVDITISISPNNEVWIVSITMPYHSNHTIVTISYHTIPYHTCTIPYHSNHTIPSQIH